MIITFYPCNFYAKMQGNVFVLTMVQSFFLIFPQTFSSQEKWKQVHFLSRGGSRDFERRKGGGGALYAGHHGWPTKKTLGFRWFKKVKITLETIVFWQNIYNSIFKFSPFLYAMKLTDEIFSIFQNLQML